MLSKRNAAVAEAAPRYGLSSSYAFRLASDVSFSFGDCPFGPESAAFWQTRRFARRRGLVTPSFQGTSTPCLLPVQLAHLICDMCQQTKCLVRSILSGERRARGTWRRYGEGCGRTEMAASAWLNEGL